jgi:alpha-1,6-mannosyltransferase
MQRPPEQVLLFAWCPLLAWEIGGSGHVDAVVMGFVVLAMLFRHREQPVLTGLFLGLAVITKFYPLVLLPALWTRRGWRVDWKLPATMAAVVAVGYACYASVGMKVFGFLGGYAKEEGIDSGARFFLLDLTQSVHGLAWVSKTCFMVFCVLVMGAISLWAWQYAMPEVCSRGTKEPHFLRAAMLLGLAMMLLFSPHYAWYVVWLIPFMALDPWLPLLVYLMSFFYLFTTGLADPGPKMFLLNEILYGIVAFMIFLQVTVLRRWSLRSIFRVDAPPENTVRSFQPQEVEAN